MNMNEIIIVGSRYGELASVVKPLYAMMTPVAQTEIKEKLGGDVVYLSPTDNQFDDDAVGFSRCHSNCWAMCGCTSRTG